MTHADTIREALAQDACGRYLNPDLHDRALDALSSSSKEDTDAPGCYLNMDDETFLRGMARMSNCSKKVCARFEAIANRLSSSGQGAEELEFQRGPGGHGIAIGPKSAAPASEKGEACSDRYGCIACPPPDIKDCPDLISSASEKGSEGQDRESYTDDQDRESYKPTSEKGEAKE